MKLYELMEMINEDSNIRITLDGTYVLAHYDGRDGIDDDYIDYDVNSFFPTVVGTSCPYISIDVSSPFHVEIWHDDFDDWAKVNVDNYSGMVTDIQASGWDWSGLMTYAEAVDYLAEFGFIDYDPAYDRYESYEEWDDYVSAGAPYEYV